MFRKILAALIVALIGGQSPAQMPANPSSEQMAEQLKGPRTRSLRNLTVQAAPPPDAPASAALPVTNSNTAVEQESVRPSLSLLIQFDFNSTTVRPESQQALVNLSKALQSAQLSDSRFAIEGHTDAQGRADYNQKLSQQRAQAVVAFLQSRGVQESRLQAIGKGASELANSAQPFAAENRRVRIVNLD